ncbi:MAG: hypothetical protein MZV63_42955 [Marinilabiliales bacterium]|nr:hypothetical protein [Marinilabiliales bacterium]
MSVALTVEMEGGHSAYPARELGYYSAEQALNKIVDNQMKAGITETVNDFIRCISDRKCSFYARAIFRKQVALQGVDT